MTTWTEVNGIYISKMPLFNAGSFRYTAWVPECPGYSHYTTGPNGIRLVSLSSAKLPAESLPFAMSNGEKLATIRRWSDQQCDKAREAVLAVFPELADSSNIRYYLGSIETF